MEDSEIVQLYWDRNEAALTETAAKYGGYCTVIAQNILHNAEDAEECVNDTYLNAWNTMPPHKPQTLSTFLGKLVRNLSFNRFKRLHSEKRGGFEQAAILEELGEIISDHESVEDSVFRKEVLNEINAFLAALPAEKRYLFIRRYWYSDSVAEIAKHCRRSENAVSVDLNRLRKKLRNDLEKRGYAL